MKVSLAICVYNEEKNIEEFLDSLNNQVFKKFKLIVVDDGSTDQTVFKIKHYKHKLNINLIKSNHVGLRKARELAVRNAKGDLIIIFDADEIIDKNCIYNMVKTFKEKDVWAVGGKINSYGKGKWRKAYSLINDLSFNLRAKKHDWLSGGCVAFRKDALEKIGGLSTGNIGEDVDASWKIKEFGKKIILLNSAFCLHKDPRKIKDILKREFKSGKRAKNLYFTHINKILDFRFLYRFSTIFFLLSFLFFYKIPTVFLLVTSILFFMKTYKLKYSLCEKCLSFFLLNLINIVWSMGFLVSIFKNEK